MKSKSTLLPSKAKSRTLSTSAKILLAANLILAIVAACAAVAVVTYLFAKPSVDDLRNIEESAEESAEEALQSLLQQAEQVGHQAEEVGHQAEEVVESHVAMKRQDLTKVRRGSCYSNPSNDTIPMAKIAARGGGSTIRWNTILPASSKLGNFRPSRWSCNGNGAFVQGGMNFSQADQRLHFPTCGYYHISSQVLFQCSTSQRNDPKQSVYHGIEVRPNCETSNTSHFIYSPHSSHQFGKQFSRTSTQISDIVCICEGGWVKVFIPTQRNVCCPVGDSASTHIHAYLIQKSDCFQ